MPELCPVEYDDQPRNVVVIEVSDRVPGERARLVVSGRNTEDDRPCTVIVIHEEGGTWAIHGLGNRGVRLPTRDVVTLAEAILARAR